MNKEDQNNSSMEFMDFEAIKSVMRGEQVDVSTEAPKTKEGNPTEKTEETLSSLTENEKVETKVETEDVESEKSKTVSSDVSNKNRELLRKLYGDKLDVIIQEVDGQEVEVSLDEIEVDEDVMEELLKQGKSIELEAATKDKISVDGISSTMEKLIEIDKNGGDITQALNAQKYVQSIDSVDMNTPEGQKHAIFLASKQQGLPDNVIQDLISGYIQAGTLAEKGLEAEGKVRAGVEAFIERERLAAIENQKKQKEDLKNFRKDLGSKLGELFEINDSFKNKLVDFSAKPDNRNMSEIDKAYLEFRQDPAKTARLAMFLNNPDEYDKQVSSAKVIESKLVTAGKAKLTRTNQQQLSQKKEERHEGFQSFEEINAQTKN